MYTDTDVQFHVCDKTRIAVILNETALFQLARRVPPSALEMFASRAWLCAPSKPHVCRHAEVLVSNGGCTALFLHGLQR